MTTPNNILGTEYTLSDLLKIHAKEIGLNTNCHAVGVIQSFDSDNQTAVVKIAYKKTFVRQDPQTGTPKTVLGDYPVLIDCPIISLYGGHFALTFPITAGDTCLLLFNDRALDEWFASGQVGPIASQRLHSMADGVALVGLRSSPQALAAYDTTRALLQSLSGLKAVIGISQNKVRIQNDTYTLLFILENLITVLEAIFASPTNTAGNPISPGAAGVLEPVRAQLQVLLE